MYIRLIFMFVHIVALVNKITFTFVIRHYELLSSLNWAFMGSFINFYNHQTVLN